MTSPAAINRTSSTSFQWLHSWVVGHLRTFLRTYVRMYVVCEKCQNIHCLEHVQYVVLNSLKLFFFYDTIKLKIIQVTVLSMLIPHCVYFVHAQNFFNFRVRKEEVTAVRIGIFGSWHTWAMTDGFFWTGLRLTDWPHTGQLAVQSTAFHWFASARL